MCIWHTYTKYSLLFRESCVSGILHTLITHYSSGRVVYLTLSIHFLLIRARCVSDILHTLNTHLGELCTSHSPYSNYSLLIRECCVSDILHTLITPYSSVRVVYLTFSIHLLLITRQEELLIWHSTYINYSLLIRGSCVSDIPHTLIINYSSGRVVYLTFSIH